MVGFFRAVDAAEADAFRVVGVAVEDGDDGTGEVAKEPYRGKNKRGREESKKKPESAST